MKSVRQGNWVESMRLQYPAIPCNTSVHPLAGIWAPPPQTLVKINRRARTHNSKLPNTPPQRKCSKAAIHYHNTWLQKCLEHRTKQTLRHMRPPLNLPRCFVCSSCTCKKFDSKRACQRPISSLRLLFGPAALDTQLNEA